MNTIKMTPVLSDKLLAIAGSLDIVNEYAWQIVDELMTKADIQPTDDVPDIIMELLELRESIDNIREKAVYLASPF